MQLVLAITGGIKKESGWGFVSRPFEILESFY